MTLFLVIPCYNEEAVLPVTVKAVEEKMRGLMSAGKISADSRALFVDDGSRDKTWRMIEEYHAGNPLFCGVKLSHNAGHQNALLSGLMAAKPLCDAVISMDADLQDDINAIDGCIEKYEDGCDIVYCVRNSRETDSFFKRSTAQAFYKIMTMLGAESVYNHADYRLMSRRALDALESYTEVNLFLRGIVPLLGYKYGYVYYNRGKRAAGESKYPLLKMLAFAAEGITSFSVKPLRIISGLGLLVAMGSVIGLIYSLISKLTGGAVAGWASIISFISLLSGVQLLCIGVCGEYIGKIYSEVKARPRYNIEKTLF